MRLIRKKQYRFLVKCSIAALFILSPFITWSQVLDSIGLDTMPTYTLTKALKQDPLQVYKLNLKKLKLSELPEEIYQFKNLNVLELNRNKFKIFPTQIGEFKYLQELYISNNKIEIITKELGNLKHLKRLEANQNGLVSLPPEIKFLKELQFMDLWGNDIGALPREIAELRGNLLEIDMRVILMSPTEQQAIRALLPSTKLKFSKSCNCGF